MSEFKVKLEYETVQVVCGCRVKLSFYSKGQTQIFGISRGGDLQLNAKSHFYLGASEKCG
jgi:hypothetical protein